MAANVETRKLVKSLRYLPRIEVERYCNDCGMTEREKYALLDYVYNFVKQTELCERLGMSRSTFIRHEKVLAIKLLRHMVSVGAIDEIIRNRSAVDSIATVELFGR